MDSLLILFIPMKSKKTRLKRILRSGEVTRSGIESDLREKGFEDYPGLGFVKTDRLEQARNKGLVAMGSDGIWAYVDRSGSSPTKIWDFLHEYSGSLPGARLSEETEIDKIFDNL